MKLVLKIIGGLLVLAGVIIGVYHLIQTIGLYF